jgi:hypothetical protein
MPLTKEIIHQWTEELSNCCRWGEDDERGTLNLIIAQNRKEEASLVTKGISVSLVKDIPKEIGPDSPKPLKQNLDVVEYKGQTRALDDCTMDHNGESYSHIDALCHIFYDQKIYNGYSKDLVKPNGTEKLGINNMKHGIFTCGVLVDVPRLKGKSYLEPDETIMPADMEA